MEGKGKGQGDKQCKGRASGWTRVRTLDLFRNNKTGLQNCIYAVKENLCMDKILRVWLKPLFSLFGENPTRNYYSRRISFTQNKHVVQLIHVTTKFKEIFHPATRRSTKKVFR